MVATAVAEQRTATTDRERLFAGMWAVAALAHVVGNGFVGNLLPTPDAGGVGLLLVSVAAIGALVRPGRASLAVLALAIIASAAVEAPVLGNHWLLAALVSLAYLLSGARWDAFEPAARIILLVFYSFAAFAKVNEGFLDPSVSCGVFYANQSLTAFGAQPIPTDSPIAAALPWLVATIELSVPLLLVIRRTRWFGVLLALGFHTAISLDLGQHFYDFTAVLAALFVLFLPPAWTQAATARLRTVSPLLRAALAGAGLMLVVILVVGALLPLAPGQGMISLLAFALWIPYAAVLLALVLAGPRRGEALAWRPAVATWLAIVLTVLNGLTPWTETKTAFGFTMYANLETAQGQTNHLIVPATAPLRSDLDRLVSVVDSSDPGLRSYIGSGYVLPWPSFVLYLQQRPGTAVAYRDGVALDGTGGRLASGSGAGVVASAEPIPWWWAWMPLRAIDTQSPPRCQAFFLPAL